MAGKDNHGLAAAGGQLALMARVRPSHIADQA
jgi:hypothetical protein